MTSRHSRQLRLFAKKPKNELLKNEEYFELPSFGKIPIYTSGYVK